MFIAALFVTAKIWKQPKCLLRENMVHVYNGILLSNKKSEIMPFVTIWIDLEIIILCEMSDKDKYHLYMES